MLRRSEGMSMTRYDEADITVVLEYMYRVTGDKHEEVGRSHVILS
jgi:hypothetical protein